LLFDRVVSPSTRGAPPPGWGLDSLNQQFDNPSILGVRIDLPIALKDDDALTENNK
jgi:hypothetical protein